MKCRFIRDYRNEFSVERMCHILNISRSTYYAFLNSRKSCRKQEDEKILCKIKDIYKESRRTYGSPRIHQKLKSEGIYCGKKRVERLMRTAGIFAISKRKYKVTTDSKHNLPIAENKLGGEFKAANKNQVWVADITYIPTQEGWLYLAAILDVYSRKIVGWAMDEKMTKELVCSAFKMAIVRRKPNPGLIHHSDRGSQYASCDYQELLKKNEMVPSMSRKGNCYDNAMMESFFHTLKTELIYHKVYETREEARRDIFEYIEVFYNRFRLHSALSYMSPENYENNRKVA